MMKTLCLLDCIMMNDHINSLFETLFRLQERCNGYKITHLTEVRSHGANLRIHTKYVYLHCFLNIACSYH